MVTKTELYLRNVIFGMIDSLVSTVGLLAGISIAGTSIHTIVTTGVVYALVEGFSMAIGSFLSEESVEDYKVKKQVGFSNSFFGALIMLVAFVLTSFIPIIPYIYFSASRALGFSILFSVLALFLVGMISAKISRISIVKRGVMMAFLGGAAIVIGLVVGKFLNIG